MDEKSVSTGNCSLGIYNHPQRGRNLVSRMAGKKGQKSGVCRQVKQSDVIGRGGVEDSPSSIFPGWRGSR
jgi:hypothetical protein